MNTQKLPKKKRIHACRSLNKALDKWESQSGKKIPKQQLIMFQPFQAMSCTTRLLCCSCRGQWALPPTLALCRKQMLSSEKHFLLVPWDCSVNFLWSPNNDGSSILPNGKWKHVFICLRWASPKVIESSENYSTWNHSTELTTLKQA